MGYKAFVSMNIAIVGSGSVSGLLAQGLAYPEHEIFIGLKEEQGPAFDYLLDEFPNITVTSIEDAAEIADVIIMTSSPAEVRETAYFLGDVRKKVIIDTSFMNFTSFGNYINTVNAIRSITGSQHVAKWFNSAGFDSLTEKGVKKEEAINMFVAGDSKKAKEMAKLLSRDMGFAYCHDFGGSDAVPLLDEMALCWHNLSLRKEKGEKIAIKITRQ